jgi:hypothetical protein
MLSYRGFLADGETILGVKELPAQCRGEYDPVLTLTSSPSICYGPWIDSSQAFPCIRKLAYC